MSIRNIVCIKKAQGNHYDPHLAISHLGFIDAGSTYKTTRLEMYNFIEKGGVAYVEDHLGNIAYVGIAISSLGTKYVRTYADGKWNNNLLALPECSW